MPYGFDPDDDPALPTHALTALLILRAYQPRGRVPVQIEDLQDVTTGRQRTQRRTPERLGPTAAVAAAPHGSSRPLLL